MSRENLSFPATVVEAIAFEYVKLHIKPEHTPQQIVQLYHETIKLVADELSYLHRKDRE